MTRRRKRGSFLRLIRTLLLLGGITGGVVWVASSVAPALAGDWDNWVFEREISGQTVFLHDYLTERSNQIASDFRSWWDGTPRTRVNSTTPSLPIPGGIPSLPRRVLADKALIGRLTIPRLNLSTVVREGVLENTLGIAAGHVPGTALPGDKSNVAVAGHRDTLFRKLQGIRDNDLIQFETLKGTYVYQVDSTKIVKPTEVGVIRPTSDSELTLVTCYPFTYIGSAPDRFIVKAHEVLESSVQADRAGVSESEPSGSEARAIPVKDTRKSNHTATAASRVSFTVADNHSSQLAPGISIGVTRTDAYGKTVDGWMWIMPERRTVWIRRQHPRDPVVFYQDGQRRELLITNVSKNTASGYLLLPGSPAGINEADPPDAASPALNRSSLNR